MIARAWPAALALVLVSCTAPAPAPAPSPPPSREPLLCRDSLGDHGPPTPDLEVFLDAAALPTRRVLQASDSGDGWLFAKVGLYVRPHLTVELAVEPPVEGAIDYGPGDRSERIVLSPCARTPGRWLVYPGGYYVRKPACLTIRVRAGGGEAVARVPVGEACKGE